jgi:hypothetical protein
VRRPRHHPHIHAGGGGAYLYTRAVGFFYWIERRARRAHAAEVLVRVPDTKLEGTRPSQAGIPGLHCVPRRRVGPSGRPQEWRCRHGQRQLSGSCLQFTPLAGGQAEQVYPAELAQSVEYKSAGGRASARTSGRLITLTFVRGGGEVVFKNTYESLSVDGRCVTITERTSLT